MKKMRLPVFVPLLCFAFLCCSRNVEENEKAGPAEIRVVFQGEIIDRYTFEDGQAVWNMDGASSSGAEGVYRLRYTVRDTASGSLWQGTELESFPFENRHGYEIHVRIFRNSRAGAKANGLVQRGPLQGQLYTPQSIGGSVSEGEARTVHPAGAVIELRDIAALLPHRDRDDSPGIGDAPEWYLRGDFRYRVSGAELQSLEIQVNEAFAAALRDAFPGEDIAASFFSGETGERRTWNLWNEYMKNTPEARWDRTAATPGYSWFADMTAIAAEYPWYARLENGVWTGKIDDWLPANNGTEGSSGPYGFRAGRYDLRAVILTGDGQSVTVEDTIDIFRNGLSWWIWGE